MDLGYTLNRSSTGTLTMNVEDTAIRSVWPCLTSIWVTRNDDPIWAGYIEKLSIQDRTLQVGMVTLDGYLNRRRLREKKVFTNTPQTVIGASLVEYARENEGIPLHGLAGPSMINRDRTYESWNRHVVGKAIEDLTGVIDGPDWFPRYEKVNNAWRMTMVFVDRLGGDRGVYVKGSKDGEGHAVDVDGLDLANLIDATGGGQEADMKIATATDPATRYPRFDDAPSFVDVNTQAVLLEYAEGEIQNRKNPWATPRVTRVAFLDRIDAGDIITVDSGLGAGTFRGRASVAGWVWRAAAGEPDRQELQVVPLNDATTAMLDQTPRECADC